MDDIPHASHILLLIQQLFVRTLLLLLYLRTDRYHYDAGSSGKTAVSIELAKRINGEIISADSRQVFEGLDIGPKTAELYAAYQYYSESNW